MTDKEIEIINERTEEVFSILVNKAIKDKKKVLWETFRTPVLIGDADNYHSFIVLVLSKVSQLKSD